MPMRTEKIISVGGDKTQNSYILRLSGLRTAKLTFRNMQPAALVSQKQMLVI